MKIHQIVFAVNVPLESWLSSQVAICNDSIALNCLDSGALLASPSTNDPNYAYHWVRDASLASHALPPAQFDRLFEFNRKIQQYDLGEPKFSLDAHPYAGAWGRPQFDGPALRALSYFDRVNSSASRALYHESLVRDLDHVSTHLATPGFDLWEEVKARSHLFTVVAQHCALERGATSPALGVERQRRYARHALHLAKHVLPRFWDGARGYILSHLGRVQQSSDGGPNLKNNLDASVVLAVLVVTLYFFIQNRATSIVPAAAYTRPRRSRSCRRSSDSSQHFAICIQSIRATPTCVRRSGDTLKIRMTGRVWTLSLSLSLLYSSTEQADHKGTHGC